MTNSNSEVVADRHLDSLTMTTTMATTMITIVATASSATDEMNGPGYGDENESAKRTIECDSAAALSLALSHANQASQPPTKTSSVCRGSPGKPSRKNDKECLV
jgi:hypothetical protein